MPVFATPNITASFARTVGASSSMALPTMATMLSDEVVRDYPSLGSPRTLECPVWHRENRLYTLERVENTSMIYFGKCWIHCYSIKRRLKWMTVIPGFCCGAVWRHIRVDVSPLYVSVKESPLNTCNSIRWWNHLITIINLPFGLRLVGVVRG